MSSPAVDVSICVLSYNGRDVLERCLQSLGQGCRGFSKEVIVTDNGSSDNTQDAIKVHFPGVHLIVNERNQYFTRPFNVMAKAARGRYLLILSNDVELKEGSLDKLLAFMETHQDVGAVVPSSHNGNGVAEPVCWQEFKFKDFLVQWTFLRWLLGRGDRPSTRVYDLQESQPVEVARDFCLLVRRKVVDQVGLYDEAFKLYYTEDDLCKRIRGGGWLIFYYTDAEVIHLLNYTTRRLSPLSVKRVYVADMLEYSRKHFGALRTYLLLRPLVFFTLALRFPVWAWARATRPVRARRRA